jgi:exonuclease V gamma subunit
VAAGLPTHRVVDPLLQARLRGAADVDAEFMRAQAGGDLPVGGSGAQRFFELVQESDDAARRALAGGGRVREFSVRAQIGATELVADGLLAADDVAVLAARSKSDRHELRLWILHLLLAAARGQGAPGLPTISRFAYRKGIVELGELDPDQARSRLQTLIEGYALGATRPLPFAPQTSRAYHKELAKNPDQEHSARAKARKALLESPHNSTMPAEGDSPANRLAWRGADLTQAADFGDWAAVVWSGFDDVKLSQRGGGSS